jgi:hypothetical protein
MPSRQDAAPNIDAYIAGFPPEIRARLESIRAAIRMAAQMPGQTLQATALVHEAWIRLGDGRFESFSPRWLRP